MGGRFSRSVRAKWDQNKTPQTLSSHGMLVEQPFPKVRSNCWRAYCAILNSFPLDGAVVLQSNELHGPPWSFAPNDGAAGECCAITFFPGAASGSSSRMRLGQIARLAAMRAWQTEVGHLACRWSEVGQRVQYNPCWDARDFRNSEWLLASHP
jgi:hypothetical protein